MNDMRLTVNLLSPLKFSAPAVYLRFPPLPHATACLTTHPNPDVWCSLWTLTRPLPRSHPTYGVLCLSSYTHPASIYHIQSYVKLDVVRQFTINFQLGLKVSRIQVPLASTAPNSELKLSAHFVPA